MGQVIQGDVEWLGGSAFRASSAGAPSIVLESAPAGVERRGPSPMEAVLLSLGGCTGIDVLSTLQKMRQDVTGYAVQVRGERRDEHPRIYTTIVVEHVVRGRGLTASAVERAVALSAEKYCSVSAMLEAAARVEVTFRIEEDEGDRNGGA